MSLPMVMLGEVICEEREQVGSFDGDSLPVLGVTNVNGVTSTGIEASEDKSKYIRLRPLRFVYNPYRINVGSIGLSTKNQEGIVSPAYVVFATKDVLDPIFLYYYLKSQKGHALINFYGNRGTVRSALRFKDLCRIEIPLPPLLEQRSIVARIEGLATKIEEARGMRRKAIEEVAALISSARNDIIKSLRKCYSDTRLGDVCKKITDGPHVSPSYVPQGVPFISVRNISETGLDFSTAKYISEADHIIYSQKAKVERGDVLYTKGGTTGVARRVDTDKEFSIWVHVALLKLDQDKALDGFVEHMLNSPSSKVQAFEYTHGSSNKDLGLTRMCNIIFPLPPLPEQRRIVAYLDALQAKVDLLRHLLAETSAELDALMPAVLDRAFKGEL